MEEAVKLSLCCELTLDELEQMLRVVYEEEKGNER